MYAEGVYHSTAAGVTGTGAGGRLVAAGSGGTEGSGTAVGSGVKVATIGVAVGSKTGVAGTTVAVAVKVTVAVTEGSFVGVADNVGVYTVGESV